MADDKTQVGQPDRSRINVEEDYELGNWAAHFGVDRETIKRAVRAIGSRAADVGEHLRRRNAR